MTDCVLYPLFLILKEWLIKHFVRDGFYSIKGLGYFSFVEILLNASSRKCKNSGGDIQIAKRINSDDGRVCFCGNGGRNFAVFVKIIHHSLLHLQQNSGCCHISL